MTRSLIAILTIQTALIVFVTVRVISIEQRTADLAANADVRGKFVTSSNSAPDSRMDPDRNAVADRAGIVSVNDVREIIRAEFDALESRMLDSLNVPLAYVEEAPVVDPREVERLQSRVESEIQSLIATGHASSMELELLQGKIAQLPPGQREEALKEVFKAINDGYLDARF